MKNTCLLKLSVGLVLLMSFNAWSQCARDDVEFYLTQGFSQEQIVELCSNSLAQSEQQSTAHQPEVANNLTATSRLSFDPIKTLISGIDARAITLTDLHIRYIGELCLRAGQSPEVNQRANKCIETEFLIAKNNLKVEKIKTGLFAFGQKSIEISSQQIDRKLLEKTPWSTFSPEIRALMKRQYQASAKSNRLSIPIKEDANAQEVAKALRNIAATSK